MAFTKMAAAECRQLRAQNLREVMREGGWFETSVDTRVLDRLRIDYEVPAWSPQYAWAREVVYAPVWVHGIWLRLEEENRSAILVILLEKARDDLNEREMICTELALDIGVTRPVRDAAQAYADLVRQAREKGHTHEHPQRPHQ
jgi:hypothetical protein